MLKLVVSGKRQWNEEKEEFIPETKDQTLQLEHSLISVFKWEGIYHKPFLSTEKDLEMIRTYAKCMNTLKMIKLRLGFQIIKRDILRVNLMAK